MLSEEVGFAHSLSLERLLDAACHDGQALVVVVGVVRDVELDRGGIDHEQLIATGDERTALRQDGAHDDGVAHATTALAVGELTRECQEASFGCRVPVLGAGEGEAQRVTAGLFAVVRQVHDLHLTAEDAVQTLRAIGLPVDDEALLADAFAEAQPAVIAAELGSLVPIEVKEATDLVAAVGGVRTLSASATYATADEGAVDEVFGFLSTPSKEELTDSGELLVGLGVPSGGVDRSAPHGAFVEGDPLMLYATIGEHPQAAIAEGERLHHARGGAIKEIGEALAVSLVYGGSRLSPRCRRRGTGEGVACAEGCCDEGAAK